MCGPQVYYNVLIQKINKFTHCKNLWKTGSCYCCTQQLHGRIRHPSHVILKTTVFAQCSKIKVLQSIECGVFFMISWFMISDQIKRICLAQSTDAKKWGWGKSYLFSRIEQHVFPFVLLTVIILARKNKYCLLPFTKTLITWCQNVGILIILQCIEY
jgi:hypothetical protein